MKSKFIGKRKPPCESYNKYTSVVNITANKTTKLSSLTCSGWKKADWRLSRITKHETNFYKKLFLRLNKTSKDV